ncbi:GNAT family N-acetyltransferase [Sulfoacidibacillus thermotolerans]|uniref:GNAT family N-acetyltransferase n=1 Tax=Sulfoacidibacillus thermotolerans TaxID=1765684 RepID=UPI0015E7F542|nr:GNAT family protein [Sulfoacidibacillus thermotolerans]
MRYLERERASIKAYLKIGFQVEGTLREAVLVKGVPMDQVVMGLLRSELIY